MSLFGAKNIKSFRSLRRMLLSVLFISAASYAGFSAMLWIFQKNMIFHPDPLIGATPDGAGLKYEDLTLETSDKVGINAWFVRAENSKGVVLFCHGNAGNMSDRLETIRLYNRLGYDFFLFDYRGYGRSGGSISERGLHADADAAWRHLTETRKIPASRIVIVGRSLGGAMASRLAAERRPAGLALESSFISIPEMGRDLYPWLPAGLLARFKFDNAASLSKVECPVMLVHSRDDEIVPIRHALRLSEAVRGPRTMLELRGGHNECYFDCEPEYSAAVDSFIQSCLR